MKAYVAKCVLGVLAFDEKESLIAYKLFEKDPEAIAKKLSDVCGEEKEVVENLKNIGYTKIFSENKIKDTLYEKDNIASRLVREKLREFSKDLDFGSDVELNKLLSQVNIQATKVKISQQKKDKILMQVIGVISEIDKATNVFSERLIEWYGLHFPEMQRVLNSNERYVKTVFEYGNRDDIQDEKLKASAKKSAGMDFSKQDIDPVKKYAKEIDNVFALREEMVAYLEEVASKIIPNMSAVAGPLLACRLLQLAGGIEKVARMPSSTLQLIGAEKALFRHMKGQGKSPKYGIIYQHPLIQQAPNDKRGKVARIIAAKLTLASRIDAYSEKNKGAEYRKELEEEVGKL